MIHIWQWDIPLPAALQFLAGPIGSALGTLLFWLLVSMVVRFVVLRIIQALARRTETDVEEVIVDISRRPLLLLIVLVGMESSLEAMNLNAGLIEVARRWIVAFIMALVTYWVWRLVKEVVIHYGEVIASRTETRLDDVLLPIANQFAPLAVFIVGGAAILQYLGVQLDALLVAIGGAAFILAFALQDILSNVFSGLSLLVDTPFKYGDLVALEDGKVCQVVRIGMRVTHLYDVGAHAVIYVPNNKLANERLVNLMQPTPELISSLRLEMSQDHDVERILALLNDVLDGHPDLVGAIDTKLGRIGSFEILSAAKQAHGVSRLRAEAEVNKRVQGAHGMLTELAAEISERERQGISREERAELKAAFPAVANALGMIENVEKRLGSHKGVMETFVDRCMQDLDPDCLAARMWGWVNEWARDPDILKGEDDVKLRHRWAPKMVSLLRRVDALRRQLERADSMESRLDDQVQRLAAWLTTEFKQPIPDWKLSGAGFRGSEDGRLTFSLFFYVDDIELEHFTRQARVEGQIRREVARRLRKEGLAFASPRYELAFVNGGRAEAFDRLSRT